MEPTDTNQPNKPNKLVPSPNTTTDVEYVVANDEEFEKRYHVIVENDDVTPMDFVILVLYTFFDLDWERAMEVMLEAHYNNQARVATYPLQEAQQRVYAAHDAARNEGYPLTFHLEPEE
jgi:ATP-dependent Clp protease adaptor protein ClpS